MSKDLPACLGLLGRDPIKQKAGVPEGSQQLPAALSLIKGTPIL